MYEHTKKVMTVIGEQTWNRHWLNMPLGFESV